MHLDHLQLVTRANIQELYIKLQKAEKQLQHAKKVLRESEASEQAAQLMRQ